jgi:hypothetical protein
MILLHVLRFWRTRSCSTCSDLARNRRLKRRPPSLCFEFLQREPLNLWDPALTLPTVIARAKTSLPAEEAREMAGVRVAHFKGDIHNTLLGFAEQSSR